MADSNITKHALAAALRDLMAEMPFEKINVAQICERCKSRGRIPSVNIFGSISGRF